LIFFCSSYERKIEKLSMMMPLNTAKKIWKMMMT
jgi:hypothetical protein